MCDRSPERLALRRRIRAADGRGLTVVPVLRAEMTLKRVPVAMGGCLPETTVRRLVRGGFVVGRHQDDGTIKVCMASLLRHLIDAGRPGYWTPERTACYLAAREGRRS